VKELARLATERVGDAVVASICGEVDRSNALVIEEDLVVSMPRDAHTVVLDPRKTTYLDGAGLRIVFDLAERARWSGQTLRLVAPPGAPVARVLVLSRAHEVARLVATVEEALDTVSSVSRQLPLDGSNDPGETLFAR
jgi:anti-anti-sigma factor